MVSLRPNLTLFVFFLLTVCFQNSFANRLDRESIKRFSLSGSNGGLDRVEFQWEDRELYLDDFNNDTDQIIPTYRTLIPVGDASYPEVTQVKYQIAMSPVPEYMREVLENHADNVQIAKIVGNVVFRDVRGVEVEIFPFVFKEGDWYSLENVTVDISGLDYKPNVETAATSFAGMYGDVFTGLNDLDEVGTHIVSGGYLVVGGETYQEAVIDWIDWKKQCGYPIHQIILEGNPSYGSVRDLIEEAYFSIDPKPEYLLLIGDPVVGVMEMPTHHYTVYQSTPYATDHPYVQLEGDDYFPEMWVGRWSVTTPTEAVTVARKTVAYEKGTMFSNTIHEGWIERGLIVSNLYHSSVVMLQNWLSRFWLDHGFSDVQVFNQNTDPNIVIQAINGGKGWVNYRGFGYPGGWSGPEVSTYDVGRLGNSWETPIVTSIVCGGNRFDAATEPCLSEKFLRLGTANVPRGAVAFIGPSEENTSTRWNNCLNTAIYRGLLQEGINQLGPLLHRGKMGLWDAFPNNRGWGDNHSSVNLYFLCYGLMGDPGLLVRTTTPVVMSFQVQQVLPIGGNDLPVQVIREDEVPAVGVHVTAYSPSGFQRTLKTDESGFVRFTLSETDFETIDDQIFLTGTSYNTIAAVDTVNVELTGLAVRLDSLTVNGSIHPGETLELTPYLSNSGLFYQGAFTGSLSSTSPNVETVNNTNDYSELGDIGDQATPLSYSITLDDNTEDNEDLQLTLHLEFDSGNLDLALPLYTNAPKMVVLPDTVFISTDDEQLFDLDVVNNGSLTSDAGSISIEIAESIDIEVITGTQAVGLLSPGTDQAVTGFEVASGNRIVNGEIYPVAWTYENVSGRTEDGTFYLQVGNGGDGYPSSSDHYGYRAYSMDDTTFWSCPEFNWLEISPRNGGDGTILTLFDRGPDEDQVETIDLPFDFSYYGETFSEVAICSNGWISFQEDPEPYYRNWNLPGGPGPDYMICPFWDDLYVMGDVSYWFDEFAHRFVVQWSQVRIPFNLTPGESLSFQVILYDPAYYPSETGDGDIDFVYLEIYDRDSSENYSTVGIKNGNGTDGLQISYANDPGEEEIFSESAQRISTALFPDGIAVKSKGSFVNDGSGNGNGIIEANETVDLYPVLKNYGDTESGELILLAELVENDDVTLLNTSTTIGSLLPGAEESAQVPFTLEIGLLAPHESFVNLRMCIVAGEDTLRKYYESHMITSSKLTLTERYIDDDAPDGDGDGYAEAGEIINLSLEYANVGGVTSLPLEMELESLSNYAEIVDGSSEIGEANPGETAISGAFVVGISQDCPLLSILKLPLTMYYGDEQVLRDTIIVQVGEFVFSETFETPLYEQWVEVGEYYSITEEDYVSPSHSLKWSYLDQPGYPPEQTDLIASDTFRVPDEAHIRLRYFKDMSPEEVFIVKFRKLDGSVINIGSRYGLTRDWSTWDQDIQGISGNPEVQLLIYVITSNYTEGRGLFLDDILITEGFQNTIDNEESLIPGEFTVSDAWPNPFNPSTVIKVGLPESGQLEAGVYNLLGQKVLDLANGEYVAGYHHLYINGHGLASGIYFVQVKAGNNFQQTKKIILMQ